MSTLQSDIQTLTQTQEFYHPQEKLWRVPQKKAQLFIGLPKETAMQENRIALRPKTVEQLTQQEHQICIETGAGERAGFSDHEYSEAGAKILPSAKEVYENSHLILKIIPPTLSEIYLISPRSTLISAMGLSHLKPENVLAINKKRITAVSYELLEDKVGGLPFVRAMSEIAGSTAMMIAGECLSSFNKGKGIIIGSITGVTPTKVVIIGAGAVAEYAARTAIGMGASVRIFDNHLYKLRRLKQVLGNFQLYTAPIESATLTQMLQTTDIAIGALRAEYGKTACVVTQEMVQKMQAGSVIIDVSIDQGGCFETSKITSHENPTFQKYGVIHYCVPNIPSRVARTASTAFSNMFAPILLRIAERGGVDEMIFNSTGFFNGVYCYNGELTHEAIAKKFGMRYRDLGLVIAASKTSRP